MHHKYELSKSVGRKVNPTIIDDIFGSEGKLNNMASNETVKSWQYISSLVDLEAPIVESQFLGTNLESSSTIICYVLNAGFVG